MAFNSLADVFNYLLIQQNTWLEPKVTQVELDTGRRFYISSFFTISEINLSQHEYYKKQFHGYIVFVQRHIGYSLNAFFFFPPLCLTAVRGAC